MNILFFTHLTTEYSRHVTSLKQRFPSHMFTIAESREEYREALDNCNVLVHGNPSIDDLEKACNLKVIIVPFAGVAQLNGEYLKKRSIKIANSHGNALVVAERAVSLALACTGRIVEFHNDMAKGQWHRTGNNDKPFDYWFSISGKQISILGTGAIGKNIAAMLKGFGCSVLGFRKSQNLPSEDFFRITDSLHEALEFGQVIFIALPLTAETDCLISRENIHLLAGKYIINIGRGGIIEEEPFFLALENGSIAGAGIDAWYEYPTREKSESTGSKYPFYKLKNVVMSPHAASHASEGKEGQLIDAIDVLCGYLKTGELLNEVTEAY